MPKRLHAVVSGRVQGVGFRYFVRQIANELGLAGWVRNLPDHTVETEVEGPEEALEEFRQRLWKGPGLSRVDDVREESLPATGEEKGFHVRY